MSQVYFPVGSNDNLLRWTEKEDYHVLEFTSPPDNRFTPEFCAAFIEGLTYIQITADPKPLVTTSSSPKFYSNGLDFERAIATPGFFDDSYYPVMRAIIEFPWPTIAWVNGHGFAAGFTCAAAHDYIVMNPDKGFLCMNELEFGAPLPAPMLSIFRVRYGTRLAHKIALTAHRFSSKEALEDGIITARGALPEVEAIVAKVKKFASAPSYKAIRTELYREVLEDSWIYYKEMDRLAHESTRSDQFYDKIVKSYKSRL